LITAYAQETMLQPPTLEKVIKLARNVGGQRPALLLRTVFAKYPRQAWSKRTVAATARFVDEK
jgi:hypothetical protein